MEPEKLIETLAVAERLKDATRHCYTSRGRRESVAEHSWRISLMAYFVSDEFPEADLLKIMKMCLIHDIVEIDAGDTYAYDEEALKTQKVREDAAKERIFSILPEEQKEEFMALFDEFEEFATPESKFAHAMDNLQPLMLNNSNDGGDWRRHEVCAEQVYGRQNKTCLGSEKLYEVTKQIIEENNE